MNRNHLEQFDKHWELFLTRVKGQIKKRCQGGTPSYAHMNAILKDCSLDWESGDNACGRWLMNLEKEMPEKAGLIRQVLTEDMCFREDATKAGMPGVLKTAVPIAGAVASAAISRFTGATMVHQLLWAAGTAAVLTPVMKTVDQQVRDANTCSSTQAYLAQLEMYRISIESILRS